MTTVREDIPALDTPATLHEAAVKITDDARKNLASVAVINVGPLFAELAPGASNTALS